MKSELTQKRLKYCYRCKSYKEKFLFYKDSSRKDGLANICKDCNKQQSKLYREKNLDKCKFRDNEYYKINSKKIRASRARYVLQNYEKIKSYRKTDSYKKSHRKSNTKYIKKHPYMTKVHNIVKQAISDGLLLKEPCTICGSEHKPHAHHEDYKKPLDVIWMCSKHHKQYHLSRRYQC